MGVSVREGGGRLYDCAADCELGKGRIAERTTALLGKRRRMAAHMLYDLLRRVGMAVTTTYAAGWELGKMRRMAAHTYDLLRGWDNEWKIVVKRLYGYITLLAGRKWYSCTTLTNHIH